VLREIFFSKRHSFIFDEVLPLAGKDCLVHGPVVVEKTRRDIFDRLEAIIADDEHSNKQISQFV